MFWIACCVELIQTGWSLVSDLSRGEKPSPLSLASIWGAQWIFETFYTLQQSVSRLSRGGFLAKTDRAHERPQETVKINKFEMIIGNISSSVHQRLVCLIEKIIICAISHVADSVGRFAGWRRIRWVGHRRRRPARAGLGFGGNARAFRWWMETCANETN